MKFNSKTTRKLAITIASLAVVAMWFLTNFDSLAPKPDQSSQSIDSQERPLQRSVYRLVRVIDGDTIKIRYNGKTESVRLLRINTPERGIAGYSQATQALRKLLATTTTISVVFENPKSEQRDRYHRLLAYVFVDKTNINLEMVHLGWSQFWTKYGEGRFSKSFVSAEQTANKLNRGLWMNGRWNSKTITTGL